MGAVPWISSAIAAVLLLTPTYGLGVALSPLTLLASWIAFRSSTGSSSWSLRVGVAVNLVIVVAMLGYYLAAEGLRGSIEAAMALFILPAVLLVTTLARHRRSAMQP